MKLTITINSKDQQALEEPFTLAFSALRECGSSLTIASQSDLAKVERVLYDRNGNPIGKMKFSS